MTIKRSLADNSSLCQFTFADGRRCRMPRSASHNSLCHTHSREEREALAEVELGRDLASLSGKFNSAADINHALGKLFAALASGRIPARKASTLAYIAQLLMQSLPTVRQETKSALGYDAWDQHLRRIFTSSPPANHAPKS